MLRKEIYRVLFRSKFCVIPIFKDKFDGIVNKYRDIRKIIFEHFDNNISMMQDNIRLKNIVAQSMIIKNIVDYFERVQNRHNIKQYGYCKVNIICYQNPYGGMADIREFYLLGYSQKFGICDTVKCLDYMMSALRRKINPATIFNELINIVFKNTSKKTNSKFISRNILVNSITPDV